jgi:hypothetical protein
MRQFMRQQLASGPRAGIICAFTKENVRAGREGGRAQRTIQRIRLRTGVNTDVTKVHAKGGLHRAACFAIETVSSLTRATDRRFDIRHDGEVASRLTADGENPLHITVAISPLYRKQGVRGHGTSAFRDAVQSLDLAGQGRPAR